ncbi:hypothetical protein [Bartonella sp. CL434QHHD]|uniref:hypothetical protein n=1 Tax=Bartonella sp. CL434QHHD TaxID=3243529 RepID=UPI0035CF06DA
MPLLYLPVRGCCDSPLHNVVTGPFGRCESPWHLRWFIRGVFSPYLIQFLSIHSFRL